ncbi:hypothetical protein ACFL6I_07975 [candidate division KSB1 bacterium]
MIIENGAAMLKNASHFWHTKNPLDFLVFFKGFNTLHFSAPFSRLKI